jgi:uncharacterized protein YndB with AHSA1/START domain
MLNKHSPTQVTLHRDNEDQLILRFERHYEQDIERVWQALTDDTELSAWSPWNARVDAVPGGTITLTFPGASQGDKATVLEARKPHLFAFEGQGEILSWHLSTDDRGCLMVFTHTVSDPAHTPYTAAGYHICLDQLDTLLTEGAGSVHRQEMPPPDDLVRHYSEKLQLG